MSATLRPMAAWLVAVHALGCQTDSRSLSDPRDVFAHAEELDVPDTGDGGACERRVAAGDDLQDAVTALPPNCVLTLLAGDHVGPVVLSSRSFSIVAEPEARLRWSAEGDVAVLVLAGANVRVEGLRIVAHAGEPAGIGLQVREGASVLATDLEIQGAHGSAVMVVGQSSLTLDRARITRVSPSQVAGLRDAGTGLEMIDGAAVDASRLEVTEAAVGIRAQDSALAFLGGRLGQLTGPGLVATGREAVATLLLERVDISRVTLVGVATAGITVQAIREVIVEEVTPGAISGNLFSDGIDLGDGSVGDFTSNQMGAGIDRVGFLLSGVTVMPQGLIVMNGRVGPDSNADHCLVLQGPDVEAPDDLAMANAACGAGVEVFRDAPDFLRFPNLAAVF